VPEGGVGGQCLQQRQLLAQPVEDADRRRGVGHPDVHVQRALWRAPQQPPQIAPDALVARQVGVRGVAVLGGRMQPHGHRDRAGRGDRLAAAPQRLDRLGGRPARRRAQLDLGREQLVAGEVRGQVEPREDLGGDRRQRAVLVEQEQLVLDADPERLALAERVLHQPASAASAAIRPVTSAPASPLA
jgi:hypothetical protein